MDTNQNITVVKRLYEEVFNKGNMEVLDEILTTNAKIFDAALHNGKGELSDYKEAQENYHLAFPNMKVKIDEIFAVEDKVFVRWTAIGTHTGDLQGISPTNQSVKITGTSIFTFKNGKIVEIYQSWDRLGLLEQIREIEPAQALH